MAEVQASLLRWEYEIPRVNDVARALQTLASYGKGREGVADCSQKLVQLLLHGHLATGPLVHSLSQREAHRVAWAVGKLRTEPQLLWPREHTQQLVCLGQAIAVRCCQPGVMAGRGADLKQWAQLLWGLAKAGLRCEGDAREPGMLQLLQLGMPEVVRVLEKGLMTHEPQSISMIAIACEASGLSGQLFEAYAAAVAAHPGAMEEAKPQEHSNLLWACATAGVYNEALFSKGVAALRVLLTAGAKVKPQALSNTVWACATVGHNPGTTELVTAIAATPGAMEGANSQNWANLLWACASLRLYHSEMFIRGVAALQELLMSGAASDVKMRDISNALWACAVCQHQDTGVERLMSAVAERGSSWAEGNGQDLCNAAFAAAVLAVVGNPNASPQAAARALLCRVLEVAAHQPESAYTTAGLAQLHQAHLVATQHLGLAPGLPPGPLLDAVRKVAWDPYDTVASNAQQQVVSVLRALCCHAAVEQLSPDGLMYVDVVASGTGLEGSPHGLAIEFDGPHHYLSHPPGRLDGATRLRHARLAHLYRGAFLAIPWHEWDCCNSSDPAQQAAAREQYLRNRLNEVMGRSSTHPSSPTPAPVAAAPAAPPSHPVPEPRTQRTRRTAGAAPRSPPPATPAAGPAATGTRPGRYRPWAKKGTPDAGTGGA